MLIQPRTTRACPPNEGFPRQALHFFVAELLSNVRQLTREIELHYPSLPRRLRTRDLANGG